MIISDCEGVLASISGLSKTLLIELGIFVVLLSLILGGVDVGSGSLSLRTYLERV